MRRVSLIVLLVVSALPADAQEKDAMRLLQLAQSLEQSGNWGQACELYQRLYETDSTNYVYFDALRRALGQVKEYDRAIDLVERRLRMRPQEYHLLAAMGGLYYDAGRRDRADSIWNDLMRRSPRLRQAYVLVAQQMTERRMYDRAVETYLRGREATGNPADFVEELAMLHSAMQQYGEAVEEYLRLLKLTSQQVGYVQSRIASFTLKKEGLEQARRVVERAVTKDAKDIPLRRVLSWVMMEQGDYEGAFNTTQEIDRLSQAGGNEVYTFAERALLDGKSAVAVRAFADLASRVPPLPLRPAALFGLGRALERLGRRANEVALQDATTGSISESIVRPDSALRVYEELIRDYPGTPQAAQGRYRAGVVLFERFFDLDGALAAFHEVVAEGRSGTLVWDAAFMSVEVHLARGDVARARDQLLSLSAAARQYLGDSFALKLATIEYLDGAFQQASEMLSDITHRLDRDGANDAMELSFLIAENRSDSSGLARFARGELLVRKRSYGEAFEAFTNVSTSARTIGLSSRARLRAADMLVALGQPKQAIALLDSVVRTMVADPQRDRAHFRLAEIYQDSLNDPQKALEYYESFLLRHPVSIYAEEARKRIRLLRGDAS